ncbi:hypothetical protein PMAYCL1PPCAC_21127, partial [Pristionchus mayeri]
EMTSTDREPYRKMRRWLEDPLGAAKLMTRLLQLNGESVTTTVCNRQNQSARSANLTRFKPPFGHSIVASQKPSLTSNTPHHVDGSSSEQE